ncbi:GNAT family N-acetyltransferase [Paenibacillus glucanolyticus]|uniref:GNAT family N-acetyltransferase n=1 Tax=Paenibacillus glucanolyticus TaxID=59843 RepID=UPI00128D4F49|nr:GNAT family N-acetyltransferase [Paenibacillus glucanolyticus]MPY16997.1 GNAT family N-acetyltransferase [Paenibacillus glucanolyticus]|eukprot:TRINITY_DN7358_c0_g1_i1.p1 TRINITY_DN7358_c0_g1~~TRINITY_DN7358_c0_g1_i1.p1  ORF type:complete len:148 (+),score=7.17 TRINITY_DN7358_c0_g1_i1:31-474(+)
MIRLQPVNQENWTECIKLKAKPEQESFIASNLYSIAQFQFLENFEAMAIYNDQTMVGFAMYGLDSDDGNYWIYRYMIDGHHQGKGYGKEALRFIIEEIRNKPDRTNVLMLSFDPKNEQARQLYVKAGFEEIGVMPWSAGESVAKLNL